MKEFSKLWLTCSRKRFIMAVLAEGKTNEVIKPAPGATAAKIETDSRTTRCRHLRPDARWSEASFGAIDAGNRVPHLVP
jgi:hypothetical protein